MSAKTTIKRMNFMQRFERLKAKLPANVCWNWDGAFRHDGYGMAVVDRRQTTAHRAVWEMLNGEAPADMVVCHSCDNRKCVNPAHLWLGTREQNMHDKMLKGRHRGPHGDSPAWQVNCGGCKWWVGGECTVTVPAWATGSRRTSATDGAGCPAWLSKHRRQHQKRQSRHERQLK